MKHLWNFGNLCLRRNVNSFINHLCLRFDILSFVENVIN